MRPALLKSFLAGLTASAVVLLSAPFIIRVALKRLAHLKIQPQFVAHDVHLAMPWAIGLAGAFLALALAAFLVAFDIGFSAFHKLPREEHDETRPS